MSLDMSPEAFKTASNKERILSSKTACRGFESYCPCQMDIAKAVSFIFFEDSNNCRGFEVGAVVNRCPVDIESRE